MATLMERLAFLQKVPTLMKATADDETPCPGYLFEEIGIFNLNEISEISHESVGCCQCLLEYLLERLQVESCHVKLKVLKILLHLCGHSPPHFLTELRRNATFIQEVTVYSGPPDPVHGSALYQKVRHSAQELASELFNDMMSTDPRVSPCKAATPSAGMGSNCLRSGIQGFGCSPGRKMSSAVTLLDKIQKAAEVVASAVLPPSEQAGIRLHDNNYRAVVAPSATLEVAVPACAYNAISVGTKAPHRCPGKVSGGWEESCSFNVSSYNSSFENELLSYTSMGGVSLSGGTGSHSEASRESGDSGSERVEAMQVGDCCQEMALISSLTNGSKIFLSKDESQLFIKECSTLNCEVVVELLSRRLKSPTQTVQMRALCGLACLMCTDLLSLEQIFSITHVHLVKLSEGTVGPVRNKATKLCRQFEALLGTPKLVTKPPESSKPTHSGQPIISTHTSTLLLSPLDFTVSPRTAVNHHPYTNEPQPCNALSKKPKQDPSDSAGVHYSPGLPDSVNEEQTVTDNKNSFPDPYDSTEPSTNLQPTPSLFSGMELINRGKPVCLVEPVPVESDTQTGAETFTHSEKKRTAQSTSSTSSERVSAFSFLNL